MKYKSLLVAALALAAALPARAANPYVQGIWTKGNPIYTSAGAVFSTKMEYRAAVTSVAVVYHPLSAGSLWDTPWMVEREPEWAKPFLPRESWACDIGGAWSDHQGSGAVSCGINLLDTARGEAASLLSKFEATDALASQIAPSPDAPADIFIGRAFLDDSARPLVFRPGWKITASYKF